MNKAYLLIGGNVGNRPLHLQQAVKAIDGRCGRVTRQSSVYETAAWGKTDQQAFLNQALEIDTELSAENLLESVLAVETSLGRIRKERYGPRVIDIDIIFFDHAVIDLPQLTVPHPEVQNRRFALVPLQEIAPRFVHPQLQKSMTELLADCPDDLPVHLFRP